jgi:hypothetical protein
MFMTIIIALVICFIICGIYVFWKVNRFIDIAIREMLNLKECIDGRRERLNKRAEVFNEEFDKCGSHKPNKWGLK